MGTDAEAKVVEGLGPDAVQILAVIHVVHRIHWIAHADPNLNRRGGLLIGVAIIPLDVPPAYTGLPDLIAIEVVVESIVQSDEGFLAVHFFTEVVHGCFNSECGTP